MIEGQRELSSVSTYISVSLTIFPLQEASSPKLFLRPRDSTHARPWGILRSLATAPSEYTNHVYSQPRGNRPSELASPPGVEPTSPPGRKLSPVGNISYC